MLEPLGVNAEDEAVYQVLLRHPRLTQSELAGRFHRGPRSVRQSVQRLADLGLVSRIAGRPVRFLAARPDAAVEMLIARKQQELVTARNSARALLDELPPDERHRPDEELEIVFGREAVAARFQQLQRSARRELLVLDRPPYAQNPTEPNPGESDLLESGVRVRGIYAPEAFAIPGALRLLREAVAAGEEARVCNDVPLKLAIADRCVAILPFTEEQSTMVDSALIVHASTLLNALIRLFELLWQASAPLDGGPERRPDAGTTSGEVSGAKHAQGEPDSERLLMQLLAAGLKDEAIARQLGVSLRTVHRRISELLERLGARTRFQAGLQAARHGLLPAGRDPLAERVARDESAADFAQM